MNLYSRGLVLVFLLVLLAGCSSPTVNRPIPNPDKYIKHQDDLCFPRQSLVINESCDLDNMRSELIEEYRHYLRHYMGEVVFHYRPNAPKWDGGEYYGQISFCLEVDGSVHKVELLQPSGHVALDNAFLTAVESLDKQPIPEDPCLLNFVHYKRTFLYYDHMDMAE